LPELVIRYGKWSAGLVILVERVDVGFQRTVGLNHAGQEQSGVDEVHLDKILSRKLVLPA
jgi:hypothetical protein